MGRSHVVILGAGASLAAFPNGDKWGKRLPLMNNLVEVLGLGKELDAAGIVHEGLNFEDLYSGLVTGGKHPEIVQMLEAMVFSYFHGMRLPDRPTIYDRLVLSLRPKDMIASFNWDPYLLQALTRNFSALKTKAPEVRFLHGCTWLTYCDRHQPIQLFQARAICPRCGQETKMTPLLYPVAAKNYNADPVLRHAWADVQLAMKNAFLLTVFGYSAPKTDVEAMGLLKDGWGATEGRALEEVEIIDLKTEDELVEVWRPFIHSHHYGTYTDCRYSLIMRYPRRSCESFWNMTQDLAPDPERPIPARLGLKSLQAWFRPAIEQEAEYEERQSRRTTSEGVQP